MAPRFGGEDAGQNPPFGATVFFRIPANYDGRTPVTLTFTDASGAVIRRFDLHPKAAHEPKPEAVAEMTPTEQKTLAERRLTGIKAGMNAFQWDLRFPDATEVTGFYPPAAAGGLPDEVSGPQVTPGEYHAVLTYGGQEMTQPFTVSLDPGIHASSSDLADRLALQQQIHTNLDSLDRTINRAIEMRDRLRKAGNAPAAVAGLDSAIDAAVQLDIHSSEGSLLHETRLRSHLAYLAADIDLAYGAPTAAQRAVFAQLVRDVEAREAELRAAMGRAGGAAD